MPGAFPRATQGIPLAERSGPDNKLKRGLRGSEPVLIGIPLFSLFLSVKHCVRPPIGGSIKRAKSMPIQLPLPILLHSRVPLAGETSVRCRVRFRWKKEKREV